MSGFANSKQLRDLARNPAAYARFQMTGQLPAVKAPDSPLIRALERIAPRDLALIRGLVVDPRLGYNGHRVFATATQALRWCKPDDMVLSGHSFPADSWRMKHFSKELRIGDVLAQAASFPEHLRKHVLSGAPTPAPTTASDSPEGLPENPVEEGQIKGRPDEPADSDSPRP